MTTIYYNILQLILRCQHGIISQSTELNYGPDSWCYTFVFANGNPFNVTAHPYFMRAGGGEKQGFRGMTATKPVIKHHLLKGLHYGCNL